MGTYLSERFQQKLKDRENYEETVVKSCLQKYLRGDKIKFIDAIKQRVCSCSKRFHMASLLLSIFIKSMNNHEDIEFIFDQTFIRHLLYIDGFEGTSKKYPKLIDFVKNNPNYILDLPRHLGDSNIYGFASNLKNSLSMQNLLNRPRIRKFVKNYQKIF